MANWCSTSYVIESDNQELLQQICNVINECAEMKEPLISKSSVNWAGNTFKKLGIDPDKADRTFWSDARMESGNLHFFEESAWGRGDAIEVLHEHYVNEEGDCPLSVYFISEELGCGIFQTNDEDGEYFADKYIFVSTDDTCYYESFEELEKDVQDYLEVDTDFESVEDMQEALDEANKKDDSKIGSVYEVEYVDLMY